MTDHSWLRAWEALVRVFRTLLPEDQREVELFAAYLVQKRRTHERRLLAPEDRADALSHEDTP